MLKEEKELLNFCHSTWFECRETIVDEDRYKKEKKLITALVRAVREDCAKVVEECGNDELYEAVADAVRKGKPVQQCTYCGLMKDSITSNGECQTCRATQLKEG